MREKQPFLTPGLVLGVVVLGAGIILLLDRQGILPAGRIWEFFFPAALMMAGIAKLTQAGAGSGKFWGGILTAAGALLLMDRLGYAEISFHRLWPLVIIAVGVMLVWRALEWQGEKPPAEPAALLNGWAVFGGGELRSGSTDFRGGEVLAVFGGYQIDLREADIKSEAILNANAMFGGIEIKVPDHWTVHMEGTPILGGYVDSTKHPRLENPTEAKRLVVRGFAMFGGVEVKN